MLSMKPLKKFFAAYGSNLKQSKTAWDEKYKAQVKWYKKLGLTKVNPKLADPAYIAACRERGLDPVWDKRPEGFNPDWWFVKYEPPLWASRAEIFPAKTSKEGSETSSMVSQSSGSSGSKVSFSDTVEVLGSTNSTPKHATGLTPPKSALKKTAQEKALASYLLEASRETPFYLYGSRYLVINHR